MTGLVPRAEALGGEDALVDAIRDAFAAEELGVRPADGPVVEPAPAGLRIASRFFREPMSRSCARCLSIVDVAAGQWLAVEPGDLDSPICDSCSADGDPHSHDQLLAWRRAASRSTGSAAA